MEIIKKCSALHWSSISCALLLLLVTSCSISNIRSYEVPKVLGRSSWAEWKDKTAWSDDENFIPDLDKINSLKQIINENYSFVIFGTTFCDDCKENIPKIIKILANLEIPESNIRLYGLDYDLKEPSGYYKNFSIPSTPCLFVLESEKIIGRISHPDYNWLDGLIKIVKKFND